MVAATAAHEERAAPEDAGKQRGHPDQCPDDEQQTDVMVLDVAHLVTDDAFELLAVHDRQQPCGEGDGGFLGADSGRKGIRRGVIDHIDGGLWDAFADRQCFDQVIYLLELIGICRDGP